jgi:group I intron endonuclease
MSVASEGVPRHLTFYGLFIQSVSMSRPCYIYAITHLASGRRYVGSTIAKPDRWSSHRSTLRRNCHHCSYLQNAWNKYGESAFLFSILQTLEVYDRQSRKLAELQAISEHGCFNSRVSSLGATNFENCPETRKKIRAGIANRISEDSAHREWLSDRGKQLAELARRPENRAKRAILSTELWKDPQHRQNVSQKLAKHWAKPGVRKAHSAKVRAIKGTPEARQRMSDKAKQRWANPDGALRNRKQTRWASPTAKAEHAEKMRAIWAKRRLAKQE